MLERKEFLKSSTCGGHERITRPTTALPSFEIADVGQREKRRRSLQPFAAGANGRSIAKQYPVGFKAGQIYKGRNKEVAFFTFTPLSLQKQKSKIAIVFSYQKNRFEIWLAGQNRQIQKKFWNLFKGSDWNKYHIPAKLTDGFSIVDHVLIANPNLNESERLKLHIESEAMNFINDMTDVFN
jgi:hypothetical protein